MNKNDLKTGYNIYFEDGSVGVVLLGTENGDIVASSTDRNDMWFPLGDYDSRLDAWDDGNKVSQVTCPTGNSYYLKTSSNETIIWEKKPETIKIGDVKYNKAEFEKAVKGLKPVE